MVHVTSQQVRDPGGVSGTEEGSACGISVDFVHKVGLVIELLK